jgi:ATP-dependent Clp protease ATP-binding subunit ClpC
MYEGFSGQARKAIQLAHREAARLGHDYVGTEHLLLGITREGSPGVVKLLAAFSTDPEKVYREVEGGLRRGTGQTSWDRLPFTPGALRALEQARQAAAELHHSSIGAEHLLLGAVREPESSAVQLLAPFGVTPELLQKELASLPEPENRDWMLQHEPSIGLSAARDPSPRDLESVVSPKPLPSIDSPALEPGITTASPEERRPIPDIRLDSPVVERQLEALQVVVCILAGGLIGAAQAGFIGAALAGFVGALVGCLLIGVKSNLLSRLSGMGAGMACGWLYSHGNIIVMLLGGACGLVVGFCLGDWRKLMGSPPLAPEKPATKKVETFTERI